MNLSTVVRLPLRVIPKSATVRVLSGPNRGLKWIVGSSPHGNWIGHYEREKACTLARLMRQGITFFDIGANVGFYSLLAARRGASVYAFEPLPRNVSYLKQHIRMNDFAAQVIAAAVSDRTGTAYLAQYESPATGRLSDTGTLEVQTVSVDAFGVTPDFLKIDVEGGEMAVLRGAERTLQERHPIVSVATHSDELRTECQAFLTRCGYSPQVEGHDLLAL